MTDRLDNFAPSPQKPKPEPMFLREEYLMPYGRHAIERLETDHQRFKLDFYLFYVPLAGRFRRCGQGCEYL